MDIKSLFLSGIKATEMDNYGQGIYSHHGVQVVSKSLGISIDFVPAHIVSEKATEDETLVVFNSERTNCTISGNSQTNAFTQKEIDYIIAFLESKYGTDGIISLWNIKPGSQHLSFIIKHTCSDSFIKAFENYKKISDVFNFSKDEIKMRDTFEFVWQCNANLFLNFAKEITK